MECAGLKTGILVGIGETNSPDWSWIVATQVTNNTLGLASRENLEKDKSPYWRHSNTPLPEQMKHNTQYCNDPIIQNFIRGD